MDDRFKDGFERIVSETPEGPSWSELGLTTASPSNEPPRPTRKWMVAAASFAITVMVVGVVALVVARGGASPEASVTTTTVAGTMMLTEDEQIQIQTWVNSLGLNQFDASVWRVRYDEMCELGAWQTPVALDLAERYITEDLAAGVSVRDSSIGDPTAEQGAQTLWLMTVNVCRDRVPEAAIQAGPPFMNDTPPVEPPAMLDTVCGPVHLGNDGTPEFPSTPLTPDAEDALAGTGALGEEGTFFNFYNWVVADDNSGLVLFGTPIDLDRDDAQYAYAVFEQRDGEWRASGWGGCHIEVVAEGWGGADWVIDPDRTVDVAGGAIPILLRERNCASGQAPVDREILPVVVREASRIVVTVLVEPVEGDASCQGNPWHPYTLTVDGGFEGIDLYDGREVPYVPVWLDGEPVATPEER